jgi:hypothetical protein
MVDVGDDGDVAQVFDGHSESPPAAGRQGNRESTNYT